jgi:hypothetical protein
MHDPGHGETSLGELDISVNIAILAFGSRFASSSEDALAGLAQNL